MLNFQAIIGLIAGFISLLGFFPYIITTLQGKTRPNRASWWIWGILGVLLGISYYFAGASNTIWVPVCYAICQLIIAILSLKYGEGGWNRFDRLCILGAGISMLLCYLFNSPLIALLFTLLIDYLGALPTIIKSYHEPEKESCFSWIIFFTASTLNLFALEQWSLALSAYPFYSFCLNATIATLLIFSKIKALLGSNKQCRKKRRSVFYVVNTREKW